MSTERRKTPARPRTSSNQTPAPSRKAPAGRKQKTSSQSAQQLRDLRAVRAKGVVARLVIMAAVVAAVVFGVAIFFKVSRVEVQGNSLYSAEDIIQASQIQKGDNLFTLNKAAAVGNIQASLAYVENVSIIRSMPDTIVIRVKESDTAFAVATDTNTTWLINGVGKALEKIANEDMVSYPQLLGVTIQSPAAGSQVRSSFNQPGLDSALSVIAALDGTGVLEHVASINVENDYDIRVWYDEKYEIQLGGTDRLDYKIQYLTVILDSLSEYQAGVIDLTFSQSTEARFYSKQ